MALDKMAAVMRVYRGFPKTPENQAKADAELQKMCDAAVSLQKVGIKNICFSVLVGIHPDADQWDTADALKKSFADNARVHAVEVEGDPFYSALNALVEPLYTERFKQMLSVSYTSVHLLTPEVVTAIEEAFNSHDASSVAVVPPDMPTGLRGAANNQCMAWNLSLLLAAGGFDSRDVKLPDFSMERDIQGVGEIIPALRMGLESMAIIIPNVDSGDTRETPAQAAKRANKERRINAWLARGGYTRDDLEALIMKGYPLDLRSR